MQNAWQGTDKFYCVSLSSLLFLHFKTGNQLLQIRIFVDNSVLEVYLNDGQAVLSSRMYPTLPDSVFVDMFAVGGKWQVARKRREEGRREGEHHQHSF